MVTVTSLDGVAQKVTAGDHELVVDEPAPLGEDRGPDPYDLLLAALGSCTAITLELYAQRKEWPLERVEVQLEKERAHGEDCATGGSCQRIRRTLLLDGPLSDEQRARLVEIAGRCPVARSLGQGIEIVEGAGD
jgi:putative redox protein